MKSEYMRKPNIASLIYGKIPPQSIEQEEAVLGAIMLERDKLEEVLGILHSPHCFYKDANQKIYAAVQELYRRGDPVDMLTVTAQLRKNDDLEIVGGAYYLTQLTRNIVSSAHVEAHSRIVIESYIKRELIRLSGEVMQMAYEESGDAFDILASMETGVSEIFNKKNADWKDMTRIAYDLMKIMEDTQAGKVQYLTTSIKEIDRVNGGFKGGNLVVLAARPAVGKSALANKMILDNAFHGKKVGFIPLEMSDTEVMARMASLQSGVQHWKIDRAKFINDEQQKVLESLSFLSELPIYMADSTNVNMMDIRSKSMKLQRTHGLDMLVIDYLQLIGTEKSKNKLREQEVAELSRGLKVLAMDLKIPVVILAQLNRMSTMNADKKPSLSHLRESGAIEQDADIVLLLHRDETAGILTDENGNSTEGKAQVIVAKWRNGAEMKVDIGFDKEKMKFYEYEDENPF